MFIYLRGNVWVEVPDGVRVSIIEDELQCIDYSGKVLAKFAVGDVQLYSRIKLRSGVDDQDYENEHSRPR